VAIAAERIRTISVTRLHPVIGAEIGGVDLCRPLDAETLRQIKDAWHEHTVLLFRGQNLSEDDQRRFASISARSPSGCRRSREQPGSATRRLGTT
jgi:alpha-ketoglutarate-dependent taurine dioxygenase